MGAILHNCDNQVGDGYALAVAGTTCVSLGALLGEASASCQL